MILEWDVPFWLIPSVDAAGTSPPLSALPLNELVSVGADPLGYYLLDPSKCSAGAARRITRNNLAQADGEITHRKFKSGHVIELNMQLWEKKGPEGELACGGTLRKMGDVLGEYLEAMANANGQVVWFPSEWPAGAGAPNPRMLDQVRSMGPSGNDATGASFVSVIQEKDEESPLTTLTLAFLSPLPYATDFMNWPTSPDETVSWPGAAQVITNNGTVAYYPTIRVHGPADGFALQNFSVQDEAGNYLQLIYDSSLPGAFPIPSGSYVEIDMFRNTAILHNAGGGTDNAKTCIDALNSDFFSLVPGDNDLFLFWLAGPGTEIEVDYRNAWE